MSLCGKVTNIGGEVTYTINLDPINGFYACPIGDYDGGPHSNCYDSLDELWDAIRTGSDSFLWPEVEQ